MSVYLSRSPYYLTSYRAGGVRRVGRRRFQSVGHVRAAGRIRGNRGLMVLQIRKSMVFGARKTGEAMTSGARGLVKVLGIVRNAKDRKLSFNFGPSSVIAGLSGLAILLGLAYLAHFNQVATKGYDLRRLEADRQQLFSQYEIKNMKLAEAASMNTIIHSAKADTMHRVNSTTYISPNTVLASR